MIMNRIKIISTLELQGIRREVSLFFGSAFLFLLGIVIAQIFDPRFAQLIQILALAVFLFVGFKLSDYHFEDVYFKGIFMLFVVWNVVIMTRGLDFSYDKIKLYLFSDFIFWPYVIPFAAFLIKSKVIQHRLFDWLTYSGIAFLVLFVMVLKFYPDRSDVLEQLIVFFSSGCGFILLTWKYHSNTRRLFAAVVILIALIAATVLARRNVMLTNINYFVAAFLLYLFYYAKDDFKKRMRALILVGVLLFSAALVFIQRMDTDFKLIVNRASEDTREYVFDAFFKDMQGVEWIGKGINGEYFCPLFIPDSEPIEQRDLIECGYLQLMLKGGYVSIILFLMVTLPAIYLGMFKSNNGLSKACGIVILLWLIDMIPYGIPGFSIKYFLVWFSIGICYSKTFRKLEDSYFKNNLFKIL